MSYFIITILIISYTLQILYVILLSNLFSLSRTEKHVELGGIFWLIYLKFLFYVLWCYIICHIKVYDSYVSSLWIIPFLILK